MNKQLITIISVLLMGMFILIAPSYSAAQEIVIVNSAPIRPYQEAIDAFNKTVGIAQSQPGIKSIQPYHTAQLNISKDTNPQQITKKLALMQPKLILAVGGKALKLVADLPTQVVYLMVSRPQTIIGNRQNIGGVKMPVAAATQLKKIHTNLPQIRTLGEIYNPNGNGQFLGKPATPKAAIKMLAEPITNPKKLKRTLDRFQGKIDALWLPPDPTIITPTTLDLLTLYSMNSGIPLIAFAPKYIKHGAAMVVYSRPRDMGEQAARLAIRILAGTPAGKISQEYSETARIRTNKQILKNLGLTSKTSN